MSIADLLPLLFVAAFVVNAVIRGRQAQRSREASRERRANRPTARSETDRPDASGAGPSQGRVTGGTGSEGTEGGDSAGDDLMRRIEEARRRVREAMGEGEEAPRGGPERAGGAPSAPTVSGGGPTSNTAGGMSAGSMFTGPRTTPGAPAAPVPDFLGREGEPVGTEEPPRVARRAAPTVTRRAGPPGSARLRAAKGLGADRDDIVRGFVWSVVFQEPVAISMRRRTVSPRRSP